MISVSIYRSKKKRIWGFTVHDHGGTNVCAAVSLLTLNTVNSIEVLTDEVLECEYDPAGGFLQFELPEVKKGKDSPKADILLEAMALGLRSVKENYRSEIEVSEMEISEYRNKG